MLHKKKVRIVGCFHIGGNPSLRKRKGKKSGEAQFTEALMRITEEKFRFADGDIVEGLNKP